ncbi:MAG TPA: hypothetical protein VLG37_04670 [Candidatus Saccharimonadales bacterium]|nr:hypothetical protein [Candidatus Saccharimonadales bacterium]
MSRVESRFDLGSLHPNLADSRVTIYPPVETEAGEVCSVNFGRGLDGLAVAGVLYAPLAGLVEAPYVSNVENGLRRLTYPNSWVARRADRDPLRQGLAGHRQAIKADARNLADVMKHDQPLRWLQADVQIYRPPAVESEVAKRLRRLKPQEFKGLCRELEMPIDEVRAQLIRRVRSEKRPKMIDAYLDQLSRGEIADLEYLLRHKLFAEFKVRLDGEVQPVRVLREQLPPEVRYEPVPARVEGLLVSQDPEVAPRRYRLSFGVSQAPYVAVPVLSWRKGANGERQFVFEGAKTKWDERRHRVECYSPVLGAAMVAGLTAGSIDYLGSLSHLVTGNAGRPAKGLPRYTTGVLPLVLRQSEAALLDSNYIEIAEAQAQT